MLNPPEIINNLPISLKLYIGISLAFYFAMFIVSCGVLFSDSKLDVSERQGCLLAFILSLLMGILFITGVN